MSKSVRLAKKPLQVVGMRVELNVLKGKDVRLFPSNTTGRMPRKRMCHHSLPAYHKRNMFSSGKRLENEA